VFNLLAGESITDSFEEIHDTIENEINVCIWSAVVLLKSPSYQEITLGLVEEQVLRFDVDSGLRSRVG
jgi:hypothetical protein